MLPDENLRQWLLEQRYPPKRAQAILDELTRAYEMVGVRADAVTDEVVLFLQIQESEEPARDHPLSSGVYVVGRSTKFPVSLDDRTVSRIHCVLAVKQNRTVRICDFQSSFRTSVRGKSLQPWEWCDVAEGDDILVGEHTRLRLRRSS